MNIKCFLGRHNWDGCRCTNCGKEKAHDWTKNCERCVCCGITRKQVHKWNACKCEICGNQRDEYHKWQRGRCLVCDTRLSQLYQILIYEGSFYVTFGYNDPSNTPSQLYWTSKLKAQTWINTGGLELLAQTGFSVSRNYSIKEVSSDQLKNIIWGLEAGGGNKKRLKPTNIHLNPDPGQLWSPEGRIVRCEPGTSSW